MEERNGVFNAFKIGSDLYTAAEVPPLLPGGGVFLEDGRGETLCDFLL